MTGLPAALGAFIMSLAVFYMAVGDKISFKSKSVRYSDERIDTQKSKGPSADVLICMAGAVVCSGAAFAVTGTWYYAALGLSGGYFAPRWWKARQESQRMALLQSQFTDVLGQIESAIYGGLNPYQAVEDAVPDMPRPARDVFYEILRLVRTGDTLAQAIDRVRRETGWEDLRVLCVGMNLYNRIGCDMSVVCRHALESIEDRESSRGVIEAAAAQNMMSLKILTVLPVLVVGGARAISPAFSYPLFHTVTGGLVFLFCVLWIITGNIVTRKMVNKALGRGV